MKEAVIVILNYNGEGMLRQFLPSVLTNSFFDVIVADNHSTDGSVKLMKSHFSSVPLILLSQNYGYSEGYNKALGKLEGQYRYYILLNSDVEVSSGWDKALVQWLDCHEDYASVQPKILSQQDKLLFDYAGAGGGYIDRLGYPYCRGGYWIRWNRTGASMMMKCKWTGLQEPALPHDRLFFTKWEVLRQIFLPIWRK
ncbi:glycosyltransferase [Echinicola strongylocentroti]|uniref:glycosyltransferase n=1 Tax=Echinicola strongylocentroti TaxID=1795355 RepID=UPI001FE7D9BC|nr:glycosyltransferase [Echinicola strongylocentroti]